jgi:hypothetical protein
VQARIALGALTAAAVLATPAIASAPPVGPLPAGPIQHITAQKGQLVAVALPKSSGGRVWRQANTVNPKVLVKVTEGDVGSSVVIVFRATGKGAVTVAYGLTKGETAHAYASRRFTVTVK